LGSAEKFLKKTGMDGGQQGKIKYIKVFEYKKWREVGCSWRVGGKTSLKRRGGKFTSETLARGGYEMVKCLQRALEKRGEESYMWGDRGCRKSGILMVR